MPDKIAGGKNQQLLGLLSLGLEVFILLNLAFLAFDVYIAHSINAFAVKAEWIPFWFSIAGTLMMLVAILLKYTTGNRKISNYLGAAVGVGAIAVGITGFLLHLHSSFFQELSLPSLVYTAPLVAPLAFAGVGFLLLLNRMVGIDSIEWGQWVIFLTAAGFLGNFLLSVADHAQNGFFFWHEWIPVYSSAFAFSFLTLMVLFPRDKVLRRLTFILLLLQVGVGMMGSYFHVVANLRGPSPDLVSNFLYGAPALAPLLFANLALLGWLGLFQIQKVS